jgi:DNA-binding FadR family transcriptional regulator
MVHALLSRYLEIGPGMRLPPERQLAAEFGVSRNELRKALAALESEGRVLREVGRGTFVREPPDAAAVRESLKECTSPREAMEARLLLEPELASLAAINATNEQIKTMKGLCEQMRRSPTWSAYEDLDMSFHKLIAECAGNRLLLAVHTIVNDVRRAVVWRRLDTRLDGPPTDYSSFDEHDAIVEATERRDRDGARDSMRRHLRTTNARLLGVPS